MAQQIEEKTVVPTVIVGVGGTGAEILLRTRRLVEETYGSLQNFPIVSFLWIDTDPDYKTSNKEREGSPLKDNEKYWAKVSGNEVEEMMSSIQSYPWINDWFPNELERNLTALEKGAGQVRAYGRFAFFCNYDGIRDKFNQARNRIKRQEDKLLSRYGIRVKANELNVFVAGSLSGGTGSGMLLDLGYCIRGWLQGEQTVETTALVPMPNAFAGIGVGDRVLANGYAAMMELSYFSDGRNEYVAQYGPNTSSEVRSVKAPFDYTYLVGTKNGESDFNLDQIREMMAQNIFLDLTSDFAPHKRSIRDNIRANWMEADSAGRGYPRNFLSFGISTVEIPISLIYTSLANRLAKDLVDWWRNESVEPPPDMLELVRGDMLKKMRLTETELLADLCTAKDRPYFSVISEWINSIRNEINTDDLLQCTQQGVKVMGEEKGKILRFVSGYLQPKVNEYYADHFREKGTDERSHGDYLQKMYSNRNEVIKLGAEALESELYRILEDRTQGPKFAEVFLTTVRQILENMTEKFRNQQDKMWAPNEENRQKQYNQALEDITHYKDKFGVSKQDKMEQFAEEALAGLEGWLIAIIQRKARALGLEVLERMQQEVDRLETRLQTFNQRLLQMRDQFEQQAQSDADRADALQINGLKIYQRQELNDLYRDLMEQLAGNPGNKSPYDAGLEAKCRTLSQEVLKQISPLWNENRAAEEVMQLLDLIEIPSVKISDAQEIIFQESQAGVANAPANTKLKTELDACERIFKTFNDESVITNNLRNAYNKSKPLVMLNKGVLSAANFKASSNEQVAVLGGENTSHPAAQKIIPLIEELIETGSENGIKPLGESERHRVIFVQETGAFSLRCIDGMKELRRSYQDWLGETITAKRARLRGESRDLPIPVHLTKEAPFWDIFPEDENVFKLVVQARALNVLQEKENRATKETNICYIYQTEFEQEKVEIASSWEEVPQILEVRACRTDYEEIERQVQAILEEAETKEEKQEIYQQFDSYRRRRLKDLERDGGEDSKQYRREWSILKEVAKKYQLMPKSMDEDEPPQVMTAEVEEQEAPQLQESSSPPVDNNKDFDSIKQELARYRELVAEGLISEEEYEAKKKQLLGI